MYLSPLVQPNLILDGFFKSASLKIAMSGRVDGHRALDVVRGLPFWKSPSIMLGVFLVFNKHSIRKKFICKCQRMNVKQRRSLWDWSESTLQKLIIIACGSEKVDTSQWKCNQWRRWLDRLHGKYILFLCADIICFKIKPEGSGFDVRLIDTWDFLKWC